MEDEGLDLGGKGAPDRLLVRAREARLGEDDVLHDEGPSGGIERLSRRMTRARSQGGSLHPGVRHGEYPRLLDQGSIVVDGTRSD